MKFIIYFLLLLTFCSETFSQQENRINSLSYKSEFDSLSIHKKNLTETRKLIKEQIDSLKSQSKYLSQKIDLELLETEKFFTKKFGEEIGKRIYSKQIWKGMTEKMLSASWGKPDKVDKSVKNWGTFTQWYYGKVTLFFKDGKLTDWEEDKN